MADWDRNRDMSGDRAWREDRDRREEFGRRGPDRDRFEADRDRFGPRGRDGGEPRAFEGPGRGPRERGPRYEPSSSYGYGDGGDTSYGQMVSGSSTSGLGGYSGANVGGWGQPVQNSQWGQGGYGPLNQGLDYGQDGGRFGPRGYDTGNFGASSGPSRPHDEHHAHYQRWRDTQLSGHDRDYANWRDQQARRYDEDYGAWRNERHSAFSREFEGWRSGRDKEGRLNAAEQTASSSQTSAYGQPDAAHGANPTLAKIADGDLGKHHHHDHHHDDDKKKDGEDLSRA